MKMIKKFIAIFILTELVICLVSIPITVFRHYNTVYR